MGRVGSSLQALESSSRRSVSLRVQAYHVCHVIHSTPPHGNKTLESDARYVCYHVKRSKGGVCVLISSRYLLLPILTMVRTGKLSTLALLSKLSKRPRFEFIGKILLSYSDNAVNTLYSQEQEVVQMHRRCGKFARACGESN